MTSPSTDTRFIYDGDALVTEYDAAGTALNRYAHGPNAGADDPLVWYVGSGTGTKRYLHADHLGSIVAATNGTGAPSINAYDEYGVPQTDAATHTINLNTGRFQYTGQAFIPELGAGMYYYKARMYSAFLGRFLQTDPIGYEGGINIYAYVGNDPTNGKDPTGLADLNLFDPNSLFHSIAEKVDYPGAYTIAGHAGLAGFRDDRPAAANLAPYEKRYNAWELLILAQKGGYEKGGLTFLAGCDAGSVRVNSGLVFAQQYAELSRGKVIASPGLVEYNMSKDGKQSLLKAKDGFYMYAPGKQDGAFLGNKVSYNPETGKATFSMDPAIGTRIPTTTVVCANPDKCKQ